MQLVGSSVRIDLAGLGSVDWHLAALGRIVRLGLGSAKTHSASLAQRVDSDTASPAQ